MLRKIEDANKIDSVAMQIYLYFVQLLEKQWLKLYGFQPLQKNVNQIEILKIEILYNILHTNILLNCL